MAHTQILQAGIQQTEIIENFASQQLGQEGYIKRIYFTTTSVASERHNLFESCRNVHFYEYVYVGVCVFNMYTSEVIVCFWFLPLENVKKEVI